MFTVAPFLNQSIGEGNWQVDTQNPDKILTVNTDSLTAEAVKGVVVKAGFKAEVLA